MARDRFTGMLPPAQFQAALDSPSVRAALAARARRLLPTTRAVALNAGATELAKELRIETGTRPGAQADAGIRRPYARIIANLTDDQVRADRGAKLNRRQILRRGATRG